MTTLNVLLLLLIFGTCDAVSGELDRHYLEQFGESASEYSRSTMKTTQDPVAKKCGMPLRHDLKRDWKSLEESTQKTLAKHLGKPALTGEAITQSNGGHFRIHYAASGTDAPPPADTNNNGAPDWVETVGNVFEAVYDREITALGYRAPPGLPYHVYLQNLSNVFGLTESETLTGQSATSYITIENDFKELAFQNSIPGKDPASVKSLKALQITAAHEFHHAIQFGYNMFFQAWYAEASATWMEDEVYDSINQLYAYTVEYLNSTIPTSLDSGNGYSRWIFNRFLYEQFYPLDINKGIWEAFAAETPPLDSRGNPQDIPMIPFIDKMLKNNGGALSSSFLGLARRAHLKEWTSHTNEAGNFHPVGTIPVTADSLYTISTPSLPAYSFTYYKVTRSNSSASPLTISYPNKPAGYTAMAFRSSSPTEYPLDANSNIIIPAFTQGDEVFLLVTNNGDGTSTVTPTPQTGTIPPPPDTIITPPATSTITSSVGRKSGCFIATAAYGSYLHPHVMALREFRDRYLLTNPPGRVFVALYYRISPPIADVISKNEYLRTASRVFLTPVIFAVKHLWIAMFTAGLIAVYLFSGYARRKSVHGKSLKVT